ncbi:MAG: carbohydrate ABC transporter permease [Anaerolineae bacterium]
MSLRTRKTIMQMVRYIVAVIALLFFMFPILWIILTAFKTPGEFLTSPPVWIPRNPSLIYFEHVARTGGFKSLLNSFIISALATLLALLIGSLAAYSLARYKVGGDNLPFFILSQRFMPPAAVIFPFLLFFKTLKWVDTYQALIIVYLTFNLPYAVWMMRGFFLEIPREIEESALVDGCGPFGAFWRISLPLVTPGLVATGVFCFIFAWAEFFFAVTLTRSTAVPLSVYIVNFFGKMMVQWGEVGATSFLAMAPLFILSFLVQRYLVRGLTLGAIK